MGMARYYSAAIAAALAGIGHCITPETMLAANRYGTAQLNPAGDLFYFSLANTSWETGTESDFLQFEIATKSISSAPAVLAEASEFVFLTNTTVLYINDTNEEVPGGVALWTVDLADEEPEGTLVASLPAPFSGLKAVLTESGDIHFVVNALAYQNNGSAYNPDLVATPASSARLYDSVYIRHWDFYIAPERYAVFSGTIKASTNGTGYSFDGTTHNLLWGIEAPVTLPETPVQPFGDLGDYDLSPDGSQVVFLTKAPELAKANYTASYLYLVPHDGSSVAEKINGPGSSAPEAAQGASGAPVWSPDGCKIAYFQQDGVYYESDLSKLYIADVSSGAASASITQLIPKFDYSVASITWSADGESLYLVAGYQGSNRLFIVPVDAEDDFVPKPLTDNTSLSTFSILPDGSALVSASAVWSSRNFYIVTPEGETTKLYFANEEDPLLAGLGPDDFDTFWYNGTLGDLQESVIVKPTNFSKDKVYDLIFYVHGGPQGVTGNTWSTRWNLRTWADQGYVLIGPNPTGSTTYGQNLTDRIQNQWGGYPYEDLVLAHEYACDNLPYINCSNAIGAGASYGGYMMNWIQGHELGRKLKAIVAHDGKSSTLSSYSTEELWFIQHDYNGTIWDYREGYERWDPLKHAKNFSTPEFIIHSDLDYRVVVTEGIAMFNVLQGLGVPSRFLNFPDETHWVTQRANSLVWHNEIFKWINYWTGKTETLSQEGVIKQ